MRSQHSVGVYARGLTKVYKKNNDTFCCVFETAVLLLSTRSLLVPALIFVVGSAVAIGAGAGNTPPIGYMEGGGYADNGKPAIYSWLALYSAGSGARGGRNILDLLKKLNSLFANWELR